MRLSIFQLSRPLASVYSNGFSYCTKVLGFATGQKPPLEGNALYRFFFLLMFLIEWVANGVRPEFMLLSYSFKVVLPFFNGICHILLDCH